MVSENTVILHVTTDSNKEMAHSMNFNEWEAIKRENKRMYCCLSCNVLSDDSVRPYPAAQCKCPNCGTRMSRVKSIFRK
jgi:rubrerythrin